MSDEILQEYCDLTTRGQEIETELEGINLRRTALAQQLYERDGKKTVYNVNGVDYIVVRSSKGKCFFTPRDKWKNRPKKTTKATAKSVEEAPTKTQKVELSATLHSSAAVSTDKTDPLAAALAEVGSQS